MKNNEFINQLEIELKDQTKNHLEVTELLEVVQNIAKPGFPERSFVHKKKFLENEIIDYKPKLFNPKWAYAMSFAIILLFIVSGVSIAASQSSIPGQTLYPVKILSEKVLGAVNPQLKDETIIRRSEEVKKLTEEKINGGLLKKTLDNYEKDIDNEQGHKEETINKSKVILEQARDIAEEKQRKEIQEVLNRQNEQQNQKTEDLEEDKEVKGVQTDKGNSYSGNKQESSGNQEKKQNEENDNNSHNKD